MKLKMFTIYDSKAFAYLPPFYLHKEEMAQRAFGECVNSKEHQFGKHPQDYTLFKVGVFDDETAVCVTFAPESLGNGLEHLKPKNTDNIDWLNEVGPDELEKMEKSGYKIKSIS